jgi:amino acid transporter
MLIVVTAASPWGPWLVLRFWKPGELDRAKAVAVGGAQLGVLALNAISRQIVQNLELGALFKPGVSAQPVDPEWGSMILFLVTFAVGVAVIAWILAQLSRASPSAPVQ